MNAYKKIVKLSLLAVPAVYFAVMCAFGRHPVLYMITAILTLAVSAAAILTRKKLLAQYLYGLLCIAVLIDLIIKKLNLRLFIDNWHDLNYGYLLPATFLILLSCVIQTVRWKVILLKIGSFKFSQIFEALMIGYLANHTLPAKAGELIKSYYLGTEHNKNKVSCWSNRPKGICRLSEALT
jgi:hypothetical protein